MARFIETVNGEGKQLLLNIDLIIEIKEFKKGCWVITAMDGFELPNITYDKMKQIVSVIEI